MATTTAAKKELSVKESTFLWEGKNKAGKVVRGEMNAPSAAVAQVTLRRQGIAVSKLKQKKSAPAARLPTRTSPYLPVSWQRW